MNHEIDTYRTIARPSATMVYKEKKSKFYGYVFPIADEEDVKPLLEKLGQQHSAANHICYAWQLGTEHIRYRTNDDGEPNNSAGAPIYGQIQSFGVTNVLVVIVRIFGGTKLGVGGLISAYRTSAQMALQSAHIIKKTIEDKISLSFSYPKMDSVMRVIKQQDLKIASQKMHLDCIIIIAVRKTMTKQIIKVFDGIQDVNTRIIDRKT